MTIPQPDRIDKHKRSLPCKLTDKELREEGQRHADMRVTIRNTRAELATVSKEYRDRLKELVAEADQLAIVLSTGEENRPIDCEERVWLQLKRAETIRLDNGKVVEQRDLTPQECQARIEDKLDQVEGDGADPKLVALAERIEALPLDEQVVVREAIRQQVEGDKAGRKPAAPGKPKKKGKG